MAVREARPPKKARCCPHLTGEHGPFAYSVLRRMIFEDRALPHADCPTFARGQNPCQMEIETSGPFRPGIVGPGGIMTEAKGPRFRRGGRVMGRRQSLKGG